MLEGLELWRRKGERPLPEAEEDVVVSSLEVEGLGAWMHDSINTWFVYGREGEKDY